MTKWMAMKIRLPGMVIAYKPSLENFRGKTNHETHTQMRDAVEVTLSGFEMTSTSAIGPA